MMLWEQGKWSLDDPVAKHIPEVAGLKVATPNGEVPQTCESREITTSRFVRR